MGCGVSKLDREDEMPAGLRPFRGRIEELKRRRRVRNISIISTTELLRPEEREEEEEEEEEEKGGKGAIVGRKEEEVVEIVGGKKDEEEELPGSPSFRFYFSETALRDSDDDSVKVLKNIKNEKLNKGKESTHDREDSNESLTSNEESETKPMRKGRRFKALSKAPSRVYSFLTVQNCSNPSSAAPSHDSPRLLTGKAA